VVYDKATCRRKLPAIGICQNIALATHLKMWGYARLPDPTVRSRGDLREIGSWPAEKGLGNRGIAFGTAGVVLLAELLRKLF